jgi:ubiquinone/menaquinone biosynthesis C-methylase UbiE
MKEFDRRWYADPRQHGEDYFLLYYPPAVLGDTARQVEGLVRLLAVPADARVLDLACGWGRVAVPLAQRGYRVTGLDLSGAFLIMARESARAAGVDIDFRQGDMREIPFVGEFDAVIMMGTAFGLLESDEEDEKVLHAVARALRPGGRFFLDQASREWVIRHYQSRDWSEREGGILVLQERELNLLESRNYVCLTIIEPDGSRRVHHHVFRFYTLTELVGMLARAGLAFRAAWGGLDGSPYTLDSHSMIVLAEKGERVGNG